MKNFLFLILWAGMLAIPAASQCSSNSEELNERKKMLDKFDQILRTSVPAYVHSIRIPGFFIYDLVKPSNKYISTDSGRSENCIDFLENHIYHFSPIHFDISLSHIGFLRGGKLTVFENVNCEHGNKNLEKAIIFANDLLKNDDHKEEILARLKNYRRYGHYRTVDGDRVFCNYDKVIPENSDKRYNRGEILGQLSDMLRKSLSEKVQEEFSWWFSVEESRASGFFVWDLTQPSNKQTSLLERIEFKNNHVYHFAFIDGPFSFSNIAVLEGGKLKIFKTINCESKGDNLDDVIGYLNEKFKNDKHKGEIIKRVKNYREYGVYAPFNGLAEPQCHFIKAEKQVPY